MRSWQPKEPHDAVTVWGQGVMRVSKVAASQKKKKKKNVQKVEKKQEKTLNFLSNYSFPSLSFFSALSPPCSRTSLAARTLIEMCKSLWRRMNRQLLAGCPMPLCVLPLNWSAPVCLPSSLLLPTLAAARFRLTSKARLRVQRVWNLWAKRTPRNGKEERKRLFFCRVNCEFAQIKLV